MIKIYTDGSCLNNPGNGGWAAIINDNEIIKKISGSVKDTTNNKMELMAPIMALQEIDKNNEIEIYTDSQYVRLGITEWIHKWIKNNWQTSKKEPVKNKELWMQLYELTKSYKIKWIWVKAHVKISRAAACIVWTSKSYTLLLPSFSIDIRTEAVPRVYCQIKRRLPFSSTDK